MYKVGGIVCTVMYERRSDNSSDFVHEVPTDVSTKLYRKFPRLCTWCTNRCSYLTVQIIPPTLYMKYQPTSVGTSCTKSEELSVQLCTNVGRYIMYKVGGIVCTVMYERRLVHHIQSRRNCLYPPTLYMMYQPTFVPNCTDNSSDFVHDVPSDVRKLSVQLGTNVGWYIMYKSGGVFCTVRYERRLVHHVQTVQTIPPTLYVM
jgi:hypothetical protein